MKEENKTESKRNAPVEEKIVKLLKKNGLTVTTAESCTGGLVAGRLVNVAGVSEVFEEGFVTYSDKAKRKELNVSKATLKKYTAVSRQTAREMAIGAAFAANADVSIATTGYAGPESAPDAPVGLVFIGCFMKDRVTVEEHHFTGNRNEIREQAVNAALDLLRRVIRANV